MINFKKDVQPSAVYGSGLAAILIFLIGFLVTGHEILLYIMLATIVILMIWPAPFRYFAVVWFAFGELLGYFVSRIILSLIYLLLVIPVGLFVRNQLRRKMQLNAYKTGIESAFKVRDHLLSTDDFEKPF
jgi:hypothetical protein